MCVRVCCNSRFAQKLCLSLVLVCARYAHMCARMCWSACAFACTCVRVCMCMYNRSNIAPRMCVYTRARVRFYAHTHTHTLSLSLKKKKKFTQRAKRQGGGDKQKRAVGQVRKCAVKMVVKYAYGPRFKCACIALEEKKILVKCLHWPHFDGTGF